MFGQQVPGNYQSSIPVGISPSDSFTASGSTSLRPCSQPRLIANRASHETFLCRIGTEALNPDRNYLHLSPKVPRPPCIVFDTSILPYLEICAKAERIRCFRFDQLLDLGILSSSSFNAALSQPALDCAFQCLVVKYGDYIHLDSWYVALAFGVDEFGDWPIC